MTGPQRKEQLLDVGRAVFAERGFDATSVEEVAHRAEVSKPVVYAHFGGKDGLYAAVVEREMTQLMGMLTQALSGESGAFGESAGGDSAGGDSANGDPTNGEPAGGESGGGHPRVLLEQAARAFLDYVEQRTDGFRILVKGSGVGSASGTLTTLLDEVAAHAEVILSRDFAARGYDRTLAAMYAQMLVGMVAFTGQWWLDVRSPGREDVVAHVVNLAWNGLSRLDPQPTLRGER